MQIETFFQTIKESLRRARYPALGLAALSAFIGGLALSRILFESFFPPLAWAGRPLPALLIALLAAGLALLLAGRQRERDWSSAIPFLPLLINLGWLFNPGIDLARGPFFFLAGLWASLLLAGWQWIEKRPASFWQRLLLPAWLLAGVAPVYLLTMSRTVGAHDVFEFQVVAPQLGIAHPTGYPLYLMLGKLFSLLPFGSVAWRINLATAVYSLIALALVYLLVRRLTGQSRPALLAALLLAFLPTYWTESIQAEVYSLHALFVSAALLLMLLVIEQIKQAMAGQPAPLTIGAWRLPPPRILIVTAGLLGLSLTNHLTTLILLPAFGLTLLYFFHAQRQLAGDQWPLRLPAFWGKMILAFAVPLSLYAYLPLRWRAVTGEAMGLARFIEWVTGSRFQDALQLTAWLNDPARYEVIARLFMAEWSGFDLLLVSLGFVYLAWLNWRAASILALTWLGYVFYGLNYYVPDLEVFILPAHLVAALVWGVAVAAVFDYLFASDKPRSQPLVEKWTLPMAALWLLLLVGLVNQGATRWPAIDQSADDGLTQWGAATLRLPLEEGAAILADSEKIAPLYYLQQAEGMRPDLEIMVLPDEAAYRAELNSRIAAGQTVYLARFLPGLEGVYHLRSLGPLTEVSRTPLTALPPEATAVTQRLAGIELGGYQIQARASYDPARAAATLYWRAEEKVDELLYIYLRWRDPAGEAGPPLAGQHPANNYYPTVAWRPGEWVADFHLLERPVLPQPASFELQAALGPPFSRPEELAWQTVTTVALPAADPDHLERPRPLRAQVGPAQLTAIVAPEQIRPQTPLPILLSGQGEPAGLEIFLQDSAGVARAPARLDAPLTLPEPAVWQMELATDLPQGRYTIMARYPDQPAVCGWLAGRQTGCPLAEIAISGVALPENAVNFEDKIALLDIDLPTTTLVPGGQLAVNLTWQALAPMNEDYTVFVQVLDEADRIVGQVDAWPLQGAYATSRWQPGEVVRDPHLLWLSDDMPAGQYRLHVGWYLLSTLRRLPVVDEAGAAVDDKVVVPGLRVGD